jgi:hypothetical protein
MPSNGACIHGGATSHLEILRDMRGNESRAADRDEAASVIALVAAQRDITGGRRTKPDFDWRGLGRGSTSKKGKICVLLSARACTR